MDQERSDDQKLMLFVENETSEGMEEKKAAGDVCCLIKERWMRKREQKGKEERRNDGKNVRRET